MFRNFLNVVKERKYDFLALVFFSLMYSIFQLFNPIMFGKLMTAITSNKDIQVVFMYVLGIFVVIFFQIGIGKLLGYSGQVLSRNVEYSLKQKGFEKLNKIKVSLLDNTSSGELLYILNEDISNISYSVSNLFLSILVNIVTLIGGTFVLFLTNRYLALFTIIPIPLILYVLSKNKKTQDDIRERLHKKESSVSSKIESSINGIHTTKLFAREKRDLSELLDLNKKVLSLTKESDILSSKYHYICDLLIDGTKCLSYGLAAFLICKNIITIGDFTTYILYVGLFLNPLSTNIYIVNQLINSNVNFESYKKFMDLEEEVSLESHKKIKSIDGDIEITNLSFSYNEEVTALKDINIKINSGQTVGFVGNSGSGKSTLCKLLYKFYDYSNGSIKIDGVNLNEIDYMSWRENIGVVQQDTYIFAKSIKENILYAKSDASFEDVIEASKKARLHDFIMTLPDGYDTFVGDKGVQLSGGEKQRIAIARVFLKNPSLLILDEATSALDYITESLVQESLNELTKNRTCIIVAHRLSTIENANKIFVFNDKSIVESGTHDELLAKGGVYHKLYNRDSSELEIEA